MRKKPKQHDEKPSWWMVIFVLAYLLLVIFIAAIIAAAAYKIFQTVQNITFCSSDVIICGTYGTNAVVVSWFFFGAFPAFVLSNYAASYVENAFKFSSPFLRYTNLTEARRSLMNIAYYVMVPIALVVSWLAYSSYFYATADQIVVRNSAFSAPLRYRWDDVGVVETKCYSEVMYTRRTYRQYHFNFDLHMHNDDAVSLIPDPVQGLQAFMAAYPEIVRQLHGRKYSFTSDTRDNCPPGLMRFLDKRPD